MAPFLVNVYYYPTMWDVFEGLWPVDKKAPRYLRVMAGHRIEINRKQPMNIKLFDSLRLAHERENFEVVRTTIEQDSEFTGTNVWILFFAILIASIGLNINATAVVIGAMLISPLMGPIIGIGTAMAINDVKLLRKASLNYAFAAGVGLVASTIYFLLTPMDDAHAEILSRTLPTTYDVLIALFGGFAGIIALASKRKGNVIPGVAIATALMPPLCTAGYGLATWQLSYFLGAFYLYLINSVFISVATFTTAYLLKFPKKRFEDPKVERRERLVIWAVSIVTLIPSVYLGYDLIQQKKFNEQANRFIDVESILPNDYLLKREVDPKNKVMTLTFGGEEITEAQINNLRSKLKYYDLENASLEIKQGFWFLKDTEDSKKTDQLVAALKASESQVLRLKVKLDSLLQQGMGSTQIFRELRVQFPHLKEAIIQPVIVNNDTLPGPTTGYLVLLRMSQGLGTEESQKVEQWLKVRLKESRITLVIDDLPASP